MHIATIIFTYKRSTHTQKVLEALEKNTVIPEKLFIFQDGLKEDDDIEEWNKVNDLIKKVDWCDTEVIVSDQNKGLACSVVSGINYVLNEYDAFIVLEDDCVPAPSFISFMYQCFEKYKNEREVYSVSGYSWSIGLNDNKESDIYFCGRISSWGWGTWKDRWQEYSRDYDILRRVNGNKEASERKAVWGLDLENHLINNVIGAGDSWAVFWAFKVIEKGGYCINPYKNLIKNIGFDGTGTHCGNMEYNQAELYKGPALRLRFPQNIDYNAECTEKYKILNGSYTVSNEKRRSGKNKVLVWGIGGFFHRHEKELNEDFEIEAVIDSSKRGYYAGKKILNPKQIADYSFDYIVVMVHDIKSCFEIVRQIRDLDISEETIKLGYFMYGSGGVKKWDVKILKDGRWRLKIDDFNISFESVDEFNNLSEIFLYKNYQYKLGNGKKDIVIDVGMNIGDSVLFFLSQDNVEKVYGYEPFYATYLKAKENIASGGAKNKEYELFPFGISNCNEKRKLTYNSQMSCGLSTDVDTNNMAYEFYLENGYISDKDSQCVTLDIKKAADIFGQIIARHSKKNIVLKMDCEGEEYAIMEDLDKSGIINKINFIMLEWHYKGKEALTRCLEKNQFSYWTNDKNERMGFIYAWKN